MTRIAIYIFTLIIITTGCSEIDSEDYPKGFAVNGEEFKESFNGVENKVIPFYPAEIDSIIDVKLSVLKLNEEYEKVDIVVYHPAVKSSTEKGGTKIEYEPYIDTTKYRANVKLMTEYGKEEWVFAFDMNLKYQWEIKK